MKKKTKVFKIGLIVMVATALPLARAGIASADYAATPYDFVGVGGDTPQFSLDFLANGDADSDLGFNATGDQRRLVTFDAESDANGRAAYYGPNEGTSSGTLQDPTDVLRDGEFPTQRTSSSGNSISALEADPGDSSITGDNINFIYSSTALNNTAGNASQNVFAGDPTLHEYEFGTDTVGLAADTTTNALSNLSDAQLAGIYEGNPGFTTWNGTGLGNGTGSGNTIVPLLPPSTSAITKTFLKAIGITQAQVSATAVKTVEQNDPTAITLNSDPADAIVPFSAARYDLLVGSADYDGGYSNAPTALPGPSAPYFPAIPGDSTFNTANAGIGYPAQPQYTPPIKLLTTPATTTVTDYIDIRQSDLADTGTNGAIEPGSSVNWADYLFAGTTGVTPYINTAAAQTLFYDSGITPVYSDKGPFVAP